MVLEVVDIDPDINFIPAHRHHLVIYDACQLFEVSIIDGSLRAKKRASISSIPGLDDAERWASIATGSKRCWHKSGTTPRTAPTTAPVRGAATSYAPVVADMIDAWVAGKRICGLSCRHR